MVSKKQSGKLPSDWTEHLSVKNGKTTMYYTNAATGQKFCSRQSLDRYLNARGVVCEAKITSAVSTGSVRSDKPTPSLAVVKEEDKPREWLPQGWIMESRKRGFTKHGSVYRVYIEKSTGCKFYSKGKVLQYLEKAHHDSNIGKENNEVNEMSDHKESVEDELHISGDKDEPKLTMSEHSESVEDKSHKSGKKNSPKSTMSEHSESVEDKCHKSGKKDAASNPALEDKGNKMEVDDDELPQGWTKELRTRSYKGKTKHDPYYTDPVTGYIFRSKKDVWRYLKTGDIKKCASKVLKGNTPQSPLPVSAKKKKHSASTSQLSDVAEKDVDEKPGSVEAVECHKSEENSVTKNEGFKQESKLADDDGVSSLIRTTPSRKSKRKTPSGPQRSSKRLAGLNRDVKEPTLSAAVKEEIGKSPPLSSKVAINGVKTSLGCGVAKDTNALFNDEAVNEVTPQQLESSNPAFNEVPPQKIDTNLYTESSNAAVSEVPPQQHDTNIYTESNNPAVNEIPPQKIDANLYSESSNAAVNEVPPQQLDTVLYNESSNAAANEPVHDTTEPGDKRSVEIDAVVSELPQEFVTNFDATGTSAVASQSRVEMDLNSTLELLFEDMDVQHQQTSLGQKNATQKEVDPKFQGDYWSDPCFDFAFKTVAGGEPFDDTIELDSCFQQHAESSSYTQGEGGGSAVPDMNAPPSLFKNKEKMNSDSVPGGISMDQLPENSICESVKASLPGGSASDF